MVSFRSVRALAFIAAAFYLSAENWNSIAIADETRTWSDTSGRFKLQATLIEVKGSDVYLKRTDGKTVKVPLQRLSEIDRQFLTELENPFEMVDEVPAEGQPTSPVANRSRPPRRSTGFSGWDHPPVNEWDNIKTVGVGFNNQSWNYTPPKSNRLPFEPKQAMLPKKNNFFEGMRRVEINPLAASAVAGYTWTFSTPTHQSRVSLIDLKTGRSVNSGLVTGNMSPLAVLNDGQTILMQGTGSDRDEYETGDQLQLWTIDGLEVTRSQSWIPFPDEKKSFGKTTNANVRQAIPIQDNRVLILADSGHLACFDIRTLRASWHMRLPSHHAITLTTDRKQLFVYQDHQLLHLDPSSGTVRGQLTLTEKPRLGWTKIRLNDSGDRMMITFVNQLRVIDLSNGETVDDYETAGNSPLSPRGLGYPAEDFALLDNHLLVHIPSRIRVCDYKDAAVICCEGGTEFIGLLTDKGGLLVPTSMPHPKAEAVLKQAMDDPSVFLIYPGVEVSLDVSGVPEQYHASVKDNLEESIKRAGYLLKPSAAIEIKASVSGPEQEAISYIARGSYVANKFTSNVTIHANGKEVWTRSSSNIPGVLMTKRGQSIQERIDELGQGPNLSYFKSITLPNLMQKPSESPQGNLQNTLMVSKFTMQGLVDN
ncbi:SHD1 domain-containing protein [Roseiconus lacunae]|uniref:SHD1 domain-containing protein n=1 Tax=Roseiconus lacunae TaxID=2605694 RepID=UPI0030893254|nr:SHD1 domain-containing protein [Stieleria sp. HD01]